MGREVNCLFHFLTYRLCGIFHGFPLVLYTFLFSPPTQQKLFFEIC